MKRRIFTSEVTVRLGDAGRDGRMRLAALARHLQDVAYDDVRDAGIGRDGNWVVRRIEIDVARLPTFGEIVRIETSCTGVGPRWAERLTNVRGDGGSDVTARALWVFVDRDGHPRALPSTFLELYPVPVGRTRISPKLRLPGPPESPAVTRSSWPVRAADFDVLGHMNNAAYWEPIDELLATTFPDASVTRAELEYRGGIEPGEHVVVAVARVAPGEVSVWLESDGTLRASARVRCADRPSESA